MNRQHYYYAGKFHWNFAPTDGGTCGTQGWRELRCFGMPSCYRCASSVVLPSSWAGKSSSEIPLPRRSWRDAGPHHGLLAGGGSRVGRHLCVGWMLADLRGQSGLAKGLGRRPAQDARAEDEWPYESAAAHLLVPRGALMQGLWGAAATGQLQLNSRVVGLVLPLLPRSLRGLRHGSVRPFQPVCTFLGWAAAVSHTSLSRPGRSGS
jgi:hypothetical protein